MSTDMSDGRPAASRCLGALEYFRAGHVDVPSAAILAVGLLIGAYFGARIGTSLPPDIAQRAFGIFLAVVGLRLALFS